MLGLSISFTAPAASRYYRPISTPRRHLIHNFFEFFHRSAAFRYFGYYLIVDMPPGTGDAQISLVQTIDIDGAIMVTTPQQVSVGDVRRGVKMFEKVNTRVLGIVENMSGYQCPHCGELVEIFGKGGGEALAEELELPFLGFVPLDPAVREGGDTGEPTVVGRPESPAGTALIQVAEKLSEILEGGAE